MVDLSDSDLPVIRVVVKVRFVPFVTRTRSHTLRVPTIDRAAIPEAAIAALGSFEQDRPVRLVGVRAELGPSAP